jgi:hypothetical protein
VKSTDNARTPDELPHDIIPDGLQLERLPSPFDAAHPPPTSAGSPDLVPVQGREPDAQPVRTEDAAPEPDGPAAARPNPPNAVNNPAKKGRATAVRGAVLISQDGETVHYRKKCLKCGYEDATRSSMRIRNIVSTGRFFFPKCRKSGEVVLRGVM